MSTETRFPTIDSILGAVSKALTVAPDEVQFFTPITRTAANDGWVTALSVPDDYDVRKLSAAALMLAVALHRSLQCIALDGEYGNPRIELTILDRHPEPVGA